MGTLYETLAALAPEHDQELLDGYARYEAHVSTLLTQAQMDDYVDYIKQAHELPVFDAMTPAELNSLPPHMQAIATTILADADACMENRRVAALLHHRGEDDVVGHL